MRQFALALAALVLTTPALAQSDIAYTYGPIAFGPYANEAPDQQMIVIRRQHPDPYRYWKAGDLWPRTRGLLDRNAPGCPYRSC